MKNIRNLVNDVVAAPLGDVIASVGEGVAAAQHALDEGSLAAVLELYADGDDAKMQLLREIGYRPTFYTLPDTTGEVRVALKLGQGAAGASSAKAVSKSSAPTAVMARLGARGLNLSQKLYASPVDAGYSNQYGYSADISAKLTFRIVPIPPPEGVDELRLVPELTGKKLSQARLLLEAYELELEIDADPAEDADPEILSQEPVAGGIARVGDSIKLTLAE
ncbi:PASTA domain-containing protein [Marinobacterium lutimaris]|uniref:PASTA domain-containing protein n=1 Tax=Marinobacterium lutimaris TaxID=568106 RepID=A0A1H5XHF6_9GAMM|nr:PASTA domain-containing protein [Marinobacterium lutimaris]SEG10905.1 PASTA domain-containing protein [Marinobacterium lutimaris]